MNMVENTLGVDVKAFLERPLFCFLGTVDDSDQSYAPATGLDDA